MCVLEPIFSDANTGSHFPKHEIEKQEFVFACLHDSNWMLRCETKIFKLKI